MFAANMAAYQPRLGGVGGVCANARGPTAHLISNQRQILK